MECLFSEISSDQSTSNLLPNVIEEILKSIQDLSIKIDNIEKNVDYIKDTHLQLELVNESTSVSPTPPTVESIPVPPVPPTPTVETIPDEIVTPTPTVESIQDENVIHFFINL